MRLTRRNLIAGTAALGAAAATSNAVGAPTERPNILWLVSEDNNPFIGAYGDKLAWTPAIDSLAARGILYRNAFAKAPVCAPSPYALITGSPAESNAPANHMCAVSKLPQGWRTTPEFMGAAGYHCTNNAPTTTAPSSPTPCGTNRAPRRTGRTGPRASRSTACSRSSRPTSRKCFTSRLDG